MKYKLICLVASLFFSFQVIAATEIWETEIKPPWMSSNGSSEFTQGSGYTLWFTLELERSPEGNLTGNVDIRSPQAFCYSNAEIEFGSIKDGIIKVKSKPIPKPGCGYFYFQGKVEGENWVGYIPWNKAKNQAIFKRVK